MIKIMATPYIVVGCSTTGGGQVISGSSFFQVEGVPVACVGDKATCPTHKTIATILTGDPHMNIMGKMAARAGDKLSCGCMLLPKQTLVVSNNSGGLGAAQHVAPAATKQNNFVAQNLDDHGIQFQIINEKTQLPITNFYYLFKLPSGEQIEGYTDSKGITEIANTGVNAEEVELITLDLSQPMKSWDA